MSRWQVSEARAKFSEMIEESKKEPQIIESHGKPVSAVIDIRLLEQFQKLKQKGAMAGLVAKLQQIPDDEREEPIVIRKSRPKKI